MDRCLAIRIREKRQIKERLARMRRVRLIELDGGKLDLAEVHERHGRLGLAGRNTR